jgi:hypothetical protein
MAIKRISEHYVFIVVTSSQRASASKISRRGSSDREELELRSKMRVRVGQGVPSSDSAIRALRTNVSYLVSSRLMKPMMESCGVERGKVE